MLSLVSPAAAYSNEPFGTSSKKLNVEPEIRFSHSPVIILENETLFSFARSRVAILTEDITTQYGKLYLFKMNKIVISTFISNNGTFTNNQHLFTLPDVYRPYQEAIEIAITSNATTPTSINIHKNGAVILMANEVLGIIRFQAVWYTVS